MREIKLNMRYPESRLEDITDAYMRGFEAGLAMRTDESEKLRESLHDMFEERIAERENAKLRELVRDLAICACGKYCYGCPHQYDGCDRDERIHELGVEV